jgi:hypothetical protein
MLGVFDGAAFTATYEHGPTAIGAPATQCTSTALMPIAKGYPTGANLSGPC